MFPRAKHTTVLGGNFTIVKGNFTAVNEEFHEGLNGRQILSQSRYVVHGAIHDSGERYPPSQCHPGTREDVLNIALRWVDKPLDESESQIFLLSGPAGVGKTAIAQSLCQRLKEHGRLGGDFFLSRSVAGHSDLHTLFPTLAHQLARAYPAFGLDLDNVIRADESILTKNMELQLEKLIVNPLKRVMNDLDTPLVLVIDGLDEAGEERDQTSFLQLLCFGFLNHQLPLKIVLTSRPEPWIKHSFSNNPPLLGSAWSHFLHRTFQTDEDIHLMLQSRFEKIQQKHELMKSQLDRWPSSEVIDDIVDRAAGQFIYASTVLRYVEDPNGDPNERLRWILKMPSKANHESIDSPFLALDNLYKQILLTSVNLDGTLTILGAVIATTVITRHISAHMDSLYYRVRVNSLPRTLLPPRKKEGNNNKKKEENYETKSCPIDRIERILNLRVNNGLLALRTIQSLVDVSSSMGLGIRFYHKSFQDFLLDRNRAGECFVNMSQIYYKLMVGSFRLMRDFEQCNTMPAREAICRDLQYIQPLWMEWWSRSTASDQDLNRLLKEAKALDPVVFYRSYASNIARNIFSSPVKRTPGACFLERVRFQTFKTVFGKHIVRGVQSGRF